MFGSVKGRGRIRGILKPALPDLIMCILGCLAMQLSYPHTCFLKPVASGVYRSASRLVTKVFCDRAALRRSGMMGTAEMSQRLSPSAREASLPPSLFLWHVPTSNGSVVCVCFLSLSMLRSSKSESVRHLFLCFAHSNCSINTCLKSELVFLEREKKRLLGDTIRNKRIIGV